MNDAPASDDPKDDVVIDADFFANILETDLANIIKKATNGLPLTKREREMIEEERSSRLKKNSTAAFTLEGEGPVAGLAGKTQQQLADAWGYSVRTIKGWIADGRAASDPAPVTSPAEMPAWFSRIYAPRQCPEKLHQAVQRILSGEDARRAAATPASVPAERLEIAEGEKGFLAMLNRYRTAEATLHAKYMAAIDAGDEIKANFLLSEWSKIGEKCRALEKIAPETLEKLGIYVRRDEIRKELVPLHVSIIKAFRQAFRLNRPRLKTADTPEAWNAITDEMIDEVSLMLVESSFAEPLELLAS